MLAKFEMAVKVGLIVKLLIEEVNFLDAGGAEGQMLLQQLQQLRALAEKLHQRKAHGSRDFAR